MLKRKKEVKSKGQFFIIAGLIGVIVIFSFVSVSLYKKYTKPEKFYDLSKNFKREAIEIIAKGKIKEYSGESGKVQEYLDNITYEYLKYAVIEDPNIEIVWIYGNASKVTVLNLGREEIKAYHGPETVTEVPAGMEEIEGEVSMGEIEHSVRTPLIEYGSDVWNRIKKVFRPSSSIIKLQIGNYNYTFDLQQNEKFYLIVKTKKENETILKIEE